MSFWHLHMEPAKEYSKLVESGIHISMAVCDPSQWKAGEDICQVMLQYEDHSKVAVANMCLSKGVFQCPLDLAFTEGDKICFSIRGADVPVTLTGICSMGYEEEDEDDEDSSDMMEDDEVVEAASPNKRKSKTDSHDSDSMRALLEKEDLTDDENEDYNPTNDPNFSEMEDPLPNESQISDDFDEDDDDDDDIEEEEEEDGEDEEEGEENDDSDMVVGEDDEDSEELDEEEDLTFEMVEAEDDGELEEEEEQESDDEEEEESSDEELVPEPPRKIRKLLDAANKEVAKKTTDPTVNQISVKKDKKNKIVEEEPKRKEAKKQKKQEISKEAEQKAKSKSSPKANKQVESVKQADTPKPKKQSETPKAKAKQMNGDTPKSKKENSNQSTPKVEKENKDAKVKTPKNEKKKNKNESADTPKQAVSKTLPGGVLVEDKQLGSGAEIKEGSVAKVYYKGYFKGKENKIFDSTLSGPPFSFRLGKGEVIKGWDVGVKGMKIGGKRKISCPPHMAYGKQGAPPTIPPNSFLEFEIQLMGFK